MCRTQLEKGLESIINVFHQYSARVGDFDTLSKGEMKQLMEQQTPNFLKNKKDPKAIGCLFEELDKDKDGQLSFEEFVICICRLLIACHDNIHGKDHQGHGHGHGPGHSHSHGPGQEHSH